MLSSNATVLLLYWSAPQSPPSVQRTVDAICSSQSLHFYALNTESSTWEEELSTSHFDCILIHNSVTYFAKHTAIVLSLIRKHFDGPLLLMKQDEHLEPYLFDTLIIDFDISSVFTCVPNNYVAVVYPKSVKHGTKFVKVEVAYITDDDTNADIRRLPKTRRLTYRGSVQPPQLGRLGFLKVRLPELVYHSQFATGTDWILDLSSRWEDRLSGDAWFDFLGDSYAVLGSESGSNLFNLDNSLRHRCLEWSHKFGEVDWDNPAVLSGQFQEDVLSRFENNVPYGTFAPRHLEAALQERPQILVSGNYGGIFKSGHNCLMIDESLATLHEVTQQLNDYEYAAFLGSSSRLSLLENDDIHVAALIKVIEDAIIADLANTPLRCGVKSGYPATIRTVILSPCPFVMDPRHDWWATIFESAGCRVSCWSFHYSHPFDDDTTPIPLLSNSEFQKVSRKFPDIQYRKSWFPQLRSQLEASLFQFSNQSKFNLLTNLVLLSNEQDSPGWLARYFLCNLWAVSELASHEAPSIVVANDLVSGFAAVIAFQGSGTVVIYDAQEGLFSSQYQLDPSFFNSHLHLFDEIERFVVQSAHLTTTVSSGLSAVLSKKFDNKVVSVPNFVPQRQFIDLESSLSQPTEVTRGVFVGNAAPRRGLIELITLWLNLDSKSELHLYIPRSDGRTEIEDHLSSYNKHKARKFIHLHEAVPVESLIKTMTQYDFGIVPYDYYFPLNHCSPNKFGQYIAAGLPILTNFQPFLAETVLHHQIGEVFSLRDNASFRRAIKRLETPAIQANYRANILRVRDEVFTWESAASPTVASALDLAGDVYKSSENLFHLFSCNTSKTWNVQRRPLVALLLDTGIMQWIAHFVPAKLAARVGSILRGR